MKHVMAIFILIILMVGCTPATPSAPPVAPPAQPTPPPTTSPAILPPTEAPPKIVEKATTFEAVKYTDPTYKFSVAYPAGWTPEPAALKGGVFYARGPYDDRVYIAVRPATNLREAAITFVNDFITATSRALVVPNIDSETTIALADGTKADVILLSAGFGQSQAGIAITGVVKDGNAIMICASRNPKNL
jgi:hypothetical protein